MTEHEHTTTERPCASCAAPLADGQDWCLECGSAQPGRLGARAGWRAALTVLAMTTLLATGAVAAAYAALSSEARREAAAPPPPPAAPQVAQPPVQTTPPTQPEATPSVEAPDSETADVPEADDAPADDGAAAGAAPAAPEPTPPAGDTATEQDEEPAAPEPIDLAADAATTYDPYGRAAGQAGDPADAVDGKPSTAWQAPVGSDGKVRIGLAVSLEEARTLSKLAFDVGTPGFTVEVYASRASRLPPDVLDARWEHLSDHRDVGTTEEVELGGKYRHVLLWITAMPADTIVRIPEVQVFG